MLGGAGQHLAGGNRRVEARGQRGMAFVVVGVQRLLDPDQVEFLEDTAHALGRGAVPLLVGIDHDGRGIAQVGAHGLHAPYVQRAVGLAHLELDAAHAALQRGAGVALEFIERRVQKASRGVVAAHGFALRAQQLGQRQARAARLDVVERHIKGRDGLHGQPAAAHGGAGPAHARPQPRNVAGVLAQQGGRDFAGMGELAGAAGALGVAQAQAPVAVAGLDLGEQHGDLGHGLLAAREHLGIADGPGQGEVAGRQAYPLDAVLAGGFGERGRGHGCGSAGVGKRTGAGISRC